MTLTDKAVRNAKPAGKPVKVFDEKGLFLLVMPAGGKWWRLKYRFGGKEKLLALGTYPDTGLKDAREQRDEARGMLAKGIDPSEQRKASKAAGDARNANSFEAVAREWFAKFSPRWALTHSSKIISRLERDIFPWIGGRPITDVRAPELLACLRRIESRGAGDTAHRALQDCGRVFRYAVSTGRAERDPSGDLRGALAPVEGGHFAAITDPKAVGGLLRACDGYHGAFVTKCALRLAPLLFLRPGELRKAEWTEINLDLAEWNIPGERMKMGAPHIVPLAAQAVAILRELHALTGSGRYVFPGARTNGRPMSDNAILAALRRMGIAKDEASGHGFRAMARTILDEVMGVRPDLIEHQLAHAVKDPNGRAYNRTAHLPERRKMMQQWSDYLDKLKAGANVIPLHGQAA
ncbi:MAG: integrase [Betaproteobacteria bacterium RIFCSPLOWO2_02_FULL_63_19]|nr:MAG: integrase [Betaproteobacteria bacterium RIFCSPLOWO2_02_FULL_63_19]